MHPMVLVFAILMLVGFYTVDHIEEATDRAAAAAIDIGSGRLNAYGAILRAFRDSNPTFSGRASPAAAGVPSWFNSSGLNNLIAGGTVYVYMTAENDAQALAIARQCGGGLTCGLAAGGTLRVPGQPTSAPLSLPAGIPAGAVVLVL